MFKLIGSILFRPKTAFEGISVKQGIWLTLIMVILAALFLNYSRSALIRPEAIFEKYESRSDMEYGLHYDEVSVPGYPVKGQEPLMPDRGGVSTPLRFTGFLGGTAAQLFLFAAGWIFMSAIFFSVVKRVGGQGSFGLSAAVAGLCWVPLFLRSLVQGIYIWSTGLPVYWSNPLAEAVLSRLDLFVIWNVFLLGVGFAVAFGVSWKRSLLLAAGYRAAVILAALGAALLTR